MTPLSDVPRCAANLRRPHSIRAKGREAIYSTADERSFSVLARVLPEGTRQPSAIGQFSLGFLPRRVSLGEEILPTLFAPREDKHEILERRVADSSGHLRAIILFDESLLDVL